jgi:hypothetical protein
VTGMMKAVKGKKAERKGNIRMTKGKDGERK